MTFDSVLTDGVLTVSLEGRLDTVTAPSLENLFSRELGNAQSLVIDCAGLSYLSSAGLRVLLGAHKKIRGAMKLTNVCESVLEIFEMTGFADILEIV